MAEPEPTEEPAEAEPVELHMTWWGSQTRHDRTIAVIELFMEQYPHINITYEFSSFGDYWPLLATKAAAGELPDVIQQDYAYFKQYVSDGLIIPLDPFVEDGTIDLSNVPDDAMIGIVVDGDERGTERAALPQLIHEKRLRFGRKRACDEMMNLDCVVRKLGANLHARTDAWRSS